MGVADLIPPDVPYRVKTPTLAEWFGVTPTTILAWVAAGRIPEPIRVGRRTHWHIVAEVRESLVRIEAEEMALIRGKRYG